MSKSTIAALLAACLVACGGGSDDPPPASTIKSVVYTVNSGGSTASITYANPAGGTEQTTTSSFTKSYFCSAGDFLYVSGQTNGSSDFASITATITINGVVAQTRTSTGPFSIATASTSC